MEPPFSTQPAEIAYPLPALLKNVIRGRYIRLPSQDDTELDNRSTIGIHNYRVTPAISIPWFGVRDHIRALEKFTRRDMLLFVGGIVALGVVALVFWALRRL